MSADKGPSSQSTCTGCWFDSKCWAPETCACSCTREGWKHTEEAELETATKGSEPTMGCSVCGRFAGAPCEHMMKGSQTRADKIAERVDPDHVDEWLDQDAKGSYDQ